MPVPIFSTDKLSVESKTRIALSVPVVSENSRKKVDDTKRKALGKEINDLQGKDAVSQKNGVVQRTEFESRDKFETAGKENPIQRNEVAGLDKKSAIASSQIVTGDKCVIYYTTDGNEPTPKTGTRYTEPMMVDKDMTIKAIAVDERGRTSKVAEARYVHFVRDKDVTYKTRPNPQYNAGGDCGLIDNLRGKENYRIGGWQGFTTDCELVIDLRESKKISVVGAGCLEEQRAWIFYPTGMEVFVSEDGKNYKPFGQKSVSVARTQGAHIQNLEVKGKAKARYVKIVLKNYGKLPEWHQSAGEQAWLFVDEIWIK